MRIVHIHYLLTLMQSVSSCKTVKNSAPMHCTMDDEDDDDGCLDRLFTVTDTNLVPIEVGIHAVSVYYSPQASTDYDLTGQIMWPVSILLAHYVAAFADKIQNSTVIELGAGGTGLPSIVATKVGASQVMATDGNDNIVLELLDKNMTRHKNGQASQLVWGNTQHIRQVLDRMGTVDAVLAADVVQWPAVIEPLVLTVKALLWLSPDALFVIGIVNRAQRTHDLFFEIAKREGFQCHKVDMQLVLLNAQQLPASSRDGGGLQMDIWELRLIDRSIPPVLLEIDATNILVGNTFQNTLSLPC